MWMPRRDGDGGARRGIVAARTPGSGARTGARNRKPCKPEPLEQTCESRCGTVKNNCRKTVDCEPCVCDSGCELCETCDTSNGQCKPDPEQLGVVCGEQSQVCPVDGSCATCDVCSSGCQYSSVQEAIDAANISAVIHICEGDFSGTITIDKNVILVGVGDGAGEGNTTLNGNENGTVVTIPAGPTVTLQTLRIDSGDNINGGGVYNQGTLTLNGCTVTGCGAEQGGGIYNTGSLTLDQSSVEASSPWTATAAASSMATADTWR